MRDVSVQVPPGVLAGVSQGPSQGPGTREELRGNSRTSVLVKMTNKTMASAQGDSRAWPSGRGWS